MTSSATSSSCARSRRQDHSRAFFGKGQGKAAADFFPGPGYQCNFFFGFHGKPLINPVTSAIDQTSTVAELFEPVNILLAKIRMVIEKYWDN
jgi:hypothetical protein